MPFFDCPMCSARYDVDDDLADQVIRCRECGEFGRVLVPRSRGGAIQCGTSPPKPAEAPLISFVCPGCKAGYEAPRGKAGEEMKCTACDGTFAIPGKREPWLRLSPRLVPHVVTRWSILLWAVGAFLLAGAGAWFFLRDRDRLTAENFPKVQPGMSAGDVSILLGRPNTVKPPSETPSGLEEWRYTKVLHDEYVGATIFVRDGVVVKKNQHGLD